MVFVPVNLQYFSQLVKDHETEGIQVLGQKPNTNNGKELSPISLAMSLVYVQFSRSNSSNFPYKHGVSVLYLLTSGKHLAYTTALSSCIVTARNTNAAFKPTGGKLTILSSCQNPQNITLATLK